MADWIGTCLGVVVGVGDRGMVYVEVFLYNDVGCIMQPVYVTGSVSRDDVDFAGSLKWNCCYIADLSLSDDIYYYYVM